MQGEEGGGATETGEKIRPHKNVSAATEVEREEEAKGWPKIAG